MIHDSSADDTVTDFGTEMTMNRMTSTAVDRAKPPPGHRLQRSVPGWENITLEKGLRSTKAGNSARESLAKGQIDHCFFRYRSNQSVAQQHGQSPQDIRIPEDTQMSTDPPTDLSTEPIQSQPTIERDMDG